MTTEYFLPTDSGMITPIGPGMTVNTKMVVNDDECCIASDGDDISLNGACARQETELER